MRSRIRRARRPSPAWLVAIVALVFAMSGGAYAATNLITTKQIKNGAVTNAKLANGAVAISKISRSARSALQGDTGATGARGDTGAAGAQGPAGAAGASGAQGPAGASGSAGVNGLNPATAVNSVPGIPAGSSTDVGAAGDSGFYFTGVSNAGTGDARSNANAFIADGQLVLQGTGLDVNANVSQGAPGIAKAYAIALSSLTDLSYQWQNNVTTTSNGGTQTPQAPTIDLTVTSANADGGTTNLIYTPGLNNTNATTGAAACSSAPIATITEGVYWQQDTLATSNCWFSSADNAGSTGGSGNPISLQQFMQRNPTAQITQIALDDGGGVGTAGSFSAGADDLLIGVNGSNTRYDFGG